MNQAMTADQAAPESDGRIDLMGLGFDPVTTAQAMARVLDGVAAGRGGWVVTPNLDILRRATVEPGFRAMVEAADLVVADGMPLIWASQLQGTPLPERVAGSSLVEPLSAEAAGRGCSLFMLGGNPGVAEEAAALLQSRYPDLDLAGTHCPPMGFESDPGEMAQIRQVLRETGPGIVLVALGSPKQELLIKQLRAEFPGIWWLGIGISLSFLTGEVSRAPSWMQRLGLEWCHRLWQEPRRLAKRYLVYGLPFAVRLMVVALLRRVRPGRTGQR